ncbi:MAG: hypothetical protein P4L16_04650 [Chlamydiales bacterium]|nr:hypothetical protein [Chlamydiales bacterium]
MNVSLSRSSMGKGLYESLAINSMKADDIKIVLDAIKNVDKTKQWVCYDLRAQNSSLFGRILYVILRWIPRVKSFFYSVNLDSSKNCLNELKVKVNQLQDRELQKLFNEAVGNFNTIAPRHQADLILENEMTPTLEENKIRKANNTLLNAFKLWTSTGQIAKLGFQATGDVSDEGICVLNFNVECPCIFLTDLNLITDRSLKHLESMRGVERIEIKGCSKISAEGVISLLRHIDKSKLSRIRLEGSCFLTPELIAQLAKMPINTYIYLGDLQPSQLKNEDLAPLVNIQDKVLQIKNLSEETMNGLNYRRLDPFKIKCC